MANRACCLNNGDTPRGVGTVCLGDADADGIDDACDVGAGPIPTVSTWGLGILALMLVVGAKVYFSRRRAIRV